ncbi:MAG: hypothetical protein K2X97_04985, partial [Mycobacteriaceae bacterium]|nr:hypothetical protein [Mycobacteriaceae bacterium]
MGAHQTSQPAMTPGPARPGAAPDVTLTPAGDRWASLVSARWAGSAANPAAAVFRRELGLPDDRPVVMSGHQARWWHAGILAKQTALAAVCRAGGASAAAAWIVVDQDASDSVTLLYPGTPAKAGDLPTRNRWRLAPEELAAQLRADVALGDLPAFTPSAPPTDGATPDAARAMRAIADCTGRWSHARNAAEQIARANAELAAVALGEAEPTLLFASRLSRTTAMRGLLEKMAADPASCVGAYNRGAAELNAAGIAPLSANAARSRFELPLWRLSPAGRPTPRKRVFTHTLGDTPLDALAPRALLMTALLRWLGCDLFIHGLGGGASGQEGGYDKVAERWFTHWLGVELAPSVVATATVLLPPVPGAGPLVTPGDLIAAQAGAHRARHH